MAKFSSAGTLQPWSPKIPPAERIPLNNTEFLQKKNKNKPLLQKPTASYRTGTTLGMEQSVCQQKHRLHVQALSLVHTTRGAITKPCSRRWAGGVTPGLCCSLGFLRACFAEAWTSEEQALCSKLSLIIKGKERKGWVDSRWACMWSQISKVFTVLSHELEAWLWRVILFPQPENQDSTISPPTFLSSH